MRHLRAVLLLVLALSLSVSLAQDFRDVSWGATAQEIRQTEIFEFVGEGEAEGNTLLIYSGTVGTLDANTFYELSPTSGLVAAAYIFQEEHVNSQDFIGDYERVENILERVYGEPIAADERWDGDLFRDNPEQYGTAVASGYLTYSTIWETEATRIQHFMSGDNFEVGHTVRYTSLANSEQQDQQMQNNEEEGF